MTKIGIMATTNINKYIFIFRIETQSRVNCLERNQESFSSEKIQSGLQITG